VSNFPKGTDILYFNDVKVELYVMNANGLFLNKAELHPILVDTERPLNGTFMSSSKVIYSITRNEIMIDSDFGHKRTVILNISTPEYSKKVYAQSEVKLKQKLINPPERVHGIRLDFFSEFNESIRWTGFPDDYYEVVLKFNYSDFYENSSSDRSVELDFNIPIEVDPGMTQIEYSYRIYGDLFLQKIAKSFRSVKTPDSLEYRKFRTIDVLVSSSTKDYYDYIYALNNDSDVPVALRSNIVNGLGVFAIKRVVKSTGHILNWNVLDSLANSDYTKSLKFVKW
jgi:hypothetical protein